MNIKTSAIFGIGGLLALALLVGCGGGGSEPPAPVPSISLSGAVARSADYNSTSLKAKFTEVTQDVNYLAGTAPQSKTYLGVPLFDVVQDALATDNNTPGATNTGNAGRRLVEHVVLSTATDGYQVAFALGEFEPELRWQHGPQPAADRLCAAGERRGVGPGCHHGRAVPHHGAWRQPWRSLQLQRGQARGGRATRDTAVGRQARWAVDHGGGERQGADCPHLHGGRPESADRKNRHLQRHHLPGCGAVRPAEHHGGPDDLQHRTQQRCAVALTRW